MKTASALAGALLLFAPSLRADDGTLADLAFLDDVDEQHIGLDLSPHEGRPFALLLDTGAETSVLSPGYAKEQGISVRAARGRPYRRATVLGRDLHFWIDVGSSDTAARTFEHGLLGGNFLAEYVIEIDYRARRVRFLDPNLHPVTTEAADPGEVVVPMRLTNGRPEIEIQLGSATAWFLVDTGAGLDLGLAEESARALGIVAADDAPIQRSANVLGGDRSSRVRVPRASVGSLEIRDLDLSIFLREGSSYRVTNIAGVDRALLGNAFLRRFRVRIDYPHRRIGLLPLPIESGAPESARAAAAPPPSTLPATDPTPMRPAEAAQERVFVEVDAPADGYVGDGPVGWIDVRGWAGSHRNREFDIAVVIDASGSTAYASGVDVDGDGKLGKARKRLDSWRTFNPRHYCSDPGDTILDAELVAARRLFEVLDPSRTRMALVTFSDRAALNAPLGSTAEAIDALLRRMEFGSGYTNFADATKVAVEALHAGSEGDADPPARVVLFLSDGYPTLPHPAKNAMDAAVAAAREAARDGVVIHAFALFDGAGEPDVFAEMASITGGVRVQLDSPGEIVNVLPRIDLADVASLDVENLTSGGRGRATRVFPDGSWDSLIEVHPGENVLRVTARGRRGGERSVERTITWMPRAPANAEESAAHEAERERFRKSLRARTEETALAAGIRRARERRAAQDKDLEVEVGDGALD